MLHRYKTFHHYVHSGISHPCMIQLFKSMSTTFMSEWQHSALIEISLSALTYPLCKDLANGRDFLCGLCFVHLNSWLYGALIFRFCCAWSHHCPHLQDFWNGIIQHASFFEIYRPSSQKNINSTRSTEPLSLENPFRLPRVLYIPLYQLLTFSSSQNWMQLLL